MKKRLLPAMIAWGLSGCATPTATPGANPTPVPTAISTSNPSGEVPLHVSITQTTRRGLTKVASTTFTARPYSETAINAALEAQNKPGPKPTFTTPSPNPTETKYAPQSQVKCLTELDDKQAAGLIQLTDAERKDFETGKSCQVLLSKDQQSWEAQKLDAAQKLLAWQTTAWKGKSEAIAAASAGRKPVSWTTNSEGEADIQLAPGKWFLLGELSPEFGIWDELAITVTAGVKQLTIADKVATVN